MNNEEGQYRIKTLEEDVKNIQEAIYGDKTYIGLVTRIKVLEERLQIFWWALAILGSTAIGLLVKQLFKLFGA